MKAGWNRLRIINGSNARLYNLAFSNKQDFVVIVSDAGLLSTPETVNNILLSPCEIIDMLCNLHFSVWIFGWKIRVLLFQPLI